MAKEIRTEIVINASRAEVWEVLTNFNDYPSWNPFIQSIEGELAIGNRLKVIIVPPNSKGMVFKPVLLVLEEHSKLTWLGSFIIKGLFDGTHHFELTDNNDGTTTFKHYEIFKGILLPFFWKKMEVNTKMGFDLMNKSLKEKIEKIAMSE